MDLVLSIHTFDLLAHLLTPGRSPHKTSILHHFEVRLVVTIMHNAKTNALFWHLNISLLTS